MSVPGVCEQPTLERVTHSVIELSWDPPPSDPSAGGLSYYVAESRKSSGGFNTVYSGSDTFCVLKALEACTQYKYRLRARNAAGFGQWSAPVAVTTSVQPFSVRDLTRAIMGENMAGVTRAVESGVPINCMNEFGTTALMASCKVDNLPITTYLLTRGADVNLQSESGKTALMFAAFAGHVDVVRVLLRYHADLSLSDRGGTTALLAACDANKVEVVLALTSAAPSQVHEPRTKMLWTPLGRACVVGGFPEVVKALLDAGADVNVRDKDGKTPLMTAAMNGYDGVVDLLLSAKEIDVKAENPIGKNALDFALSMRRTSTVKLLRPHFLRRVSVQVQEYVPHQ